MEEDDMFCTRCGKAVSGKEGKASGQETEYIGGHESEEDGKVRMGYTSGGSGKGVRAGRDDSGKYSIPADRPGFSEYDDYDEYDEYEEEESGGRRMILIISGISIIVVLGILIVLLLTTTGQKAETSPQGTVAYSDDSGLEEEGTEVKPEEKTGEIEETGKDTASNEEQAGAEELSSGENDSQSADSKDSGQQNGEKEAAEESEEKDKTDSESQKDSVSVKTEEDEEQAEGIETLENEGEAEEETEAGDSSYILPDSNTRMYSREELERLDNYTLQMAINEIYARHGRKFDTDSIREYFESKSWYRGTIDPADFDGNEGRYFNEYEMANRELMAEIRASREKKTTGSGETGKKKKSQ